jgi:hypothetical protein
MLNDDLLKSLESLKTTMIAVATGGPRIPDVDDGFQRTYARVAAELAQRRFENPLPYGSLWDWYGQWSSGDMPTYQSRRRYVSDLFAPLVERIRTGVVESFEPTGWTRVDRCVGEVRRRLADAQTEEQFQAVGLLCREILISLAQAVYLAERHTPLDGKTPSPTDAKPMLEAYFAVEYPGPHNEGVRAHARSTLNHAVSLQHTRTAGFREAALCVESTTAIVNVIAILSGIRDPEDPETA